MTRIESKPRIIEAELSYQLTGLCFKVQNAVGRFAREKQYCDKFEQLLKEVKLPYKREFEVAKFNPNSPYGNQVDFLIAGKVILDFKAKSYITKSDYLQMQRYLKAANLELGLIVNFRNQHLKPKRVLNTDFYSDNSDVNSGH